MIVDAETLDVSPVADRLLEAEAGAITSDVEFDDISWSNELAAHVIEVKTSGPAPSLSPLPAAFERHVSMIRRYAESIDRRIMPTAMHPWMDPVREMHLWPHDYHAIYEAFNRIFDCAGHGWANLQSMHINLPFCGDEEFGRLHAAIRLVLPILPALAASSPAMDGGVTGRLDNRLDAYRRHSARVPSVAGRVIPEPVFHIDQYQTQILQRIYADLAPKDPDGILQDEFANARGAIARFGRGTIEIRVIDVQECPAADLAIAAATIGVVRHLVAETWSSLADQQAWPVEPLADLFVRTIGDAEQTVIDNADYLRVFGYDGATATTGELWRHLVDDLRRRDPDATAYADMQLDTLLTCGPVARRIVHALGDHPTRDRLRDVYGRLCDCLAADEMFIA
ncbi:MAG: glutamate--cysteine ligase [Phycisphaera sp.]|nr:glutamate--cysteine ligase [Phycisphaera sp.]